jgi:hypothetical protein
MKKMIRFPMMLALASLTVFAVGCSDDDDDNPITANPPRTANVLVVHASPDAPAVDVLVDNGSPAVQDLMFPENTGYVALNSGTRNVKVNVANTNNTVINADLNLNPDLNYSVFAVNTVSSIEPLVLVDDLATPASGMTHVRFVHLSPDAPAVDVAVTGGPVLFGDVSFKDYQGFAPVNAGTYNLEVRLAGTSTVVLPLPGIALQAGNIYTVFAKGLVAGTGSQALGAEIIVNR